MSKKNDKINIPLSKILIFGTLCFLAVYFWQSSKNRELNKEKTAVAKKEVKQQKNPAEVKNKLSFSDISKILAQNPPKFDQNCDTVKWQKNEIIRYFSIDTALQKKTSQLVRRSKPKYGAAVALNPKTGQILAMVSYSDPEQPKIADNLCLSNKFPAASIFKTVIADAVFENTDFACSTKINYVGRNTTLYKKQFLPENIGEDSKSISFADAFAESINPVFGWLAVHKVGMQKMYKSAQKFGYNTKIPFELQTDISYFPEPAAFDASDSINLAELGSGFNSETTLTPLLGGLTACVVANGGVMMSPTIIDSITDKSGKRLYSATAKKWKISSAPDVCDSLVVLMRQTTKSGTARSAFSAMKDYCQQKEIIYGGKTGTKDSDLGRNEWFVGFTKDTLNQFAVATSVCFVQNPMFIMRPSQVSADIMLGYIKRAENQKELEKQYVPK
jgi:cell division protein FtsI/penicillin-binding protein 2